jgi:hypothetical protein
MVAVFPVAEWPEYEDDQSIPTSTKVKKSLPPIQLHEVVLNYAQG